MSCVLSDRVSAWLVEELADTVLVLLDRALGGGRPSLRHWDMSVSAQSEVMAATDHEA
jgi:hypothetical protein